MIIPLNYMGTQAQQLTCLRSPNQGVWGQALELRPHSKA